MFSSPRKSMFMFQLVANSFHFTTSSFATTLTLLSFILFLICFAFHHDNATINYYKNQTQTPLCLIPTSGNNVKHTKYKFDIYNEILFPNICHCTVEDDHAYKGEMRFQLPPLDIKIERTSVSIEGANVMICLHT